MSRIITAAMPAHGHTVPLLAITADLVRRGHEVVFLGGARFAKSAEATGARFVALPPEADFDDRRIDDYFPGRAELPPGPQRLAFDAQHIFIDPVPAQYRALRALLETFPATAVLHDSFFHGALALALAHPRDERPAVIGIGVAPPMLQSADTAPFGLALAPLAGPQGLARNRELNAQAAQRGEPLRRYAAEVFATVGAALPPGPRLDAAVTVPDHYLQLTVPGFEYPRSDAPASLRFIGALSPQRGEEAELPDWWEELADARSVVVVTQGTLANDDLTALVAPAVRALADRPDLFVVAATSRPDGPELLAAELGGLPSNVRATGYVPFDRLLPHADVLVSNGGYGGVHTALAFGVPLVVAGDSEDKPEVAARVAWRGVGVDLRTGRPTQVELREAVERVLGHPDYRANTRELAAELAAHRPLEAIAELVGSLG
ncbi:UDP:flavonoid glycosyltransferase YjiC (YdhE family) [Kitasatospora sp. GAS204A]|uniref:glycosyltransferase n=1 Tax=unclassified Kitasatospora TaxID=2633591 RepID=UPI002475167F|nr:nucleotide disphospho-sugar-binding domain-containing protein [Kitasatospora sp. GAS204B]MDH6116079.1 UDP:flavonoid glycosyltransferase YjiC (YdhE family) [Kitasatospora sp. GAS204B]